MFTSFQAKDLIHALLRDAKFFGDFRNGNAAGVLSTDERIACCLGWCFARLWCCGERHILVQNINQEGSGSRNVVWRKQQFPKW